MSATRSADRAETESALRSSATVKEAAEKLGLKPRGLRDRCQKMGFRAKDLVYGQAMPDGQRLKGNSTLEDADGSPLKRWVKTERDSDDPPAFQPVPQGFAVKKLTTYLDGQGQVRGQHVSAEQATQDRYDRFFEACKASAEKYEGTCGPVDFPCHVLNRDLVSFYPLGDPHIGMLSWRGETGKDFDLKIAERELYGTVDSLVAMAPPSFTGYLVNVGDFFHIENDKQSTPIGGFKLDGDSRFAKVGEVGINVLRRCIDRMLQKHGEVKVINARGNHDPTVSIMLNFVIRAYYSKDPRVEVLDNANPYIYIEFGKNLVGVHHGDGAKPGQLPSIMSIDRPEAWGRTRYRYWLTGHRHHTELREKEHGGALVEIVRTCAPEDYHAHQKGYRSGNSLDVITHHREFGRIARSTADIRLARHALSAA